MSNEPEIKKSKEADLWASVSEDLAKQKDMINQEALDKQNKENEDNIKASSDSKNEDILSVNIKSAHTDDNIDIILDIPLKLTVELGKSRMLINDLLQLGQGSVIELSKVVGEPLEVLVNKKLIGKGEVVVVKDKFGIKLTEIISAKERIESFA